MSKPARVYVGGLLDSVKKEDLEREFSKYGKLSNVWVAWNPPGFAFVEFDDTEDAEEAVRRLNGQDVCGSRIRVEMSRGRGRGGGDRGGRGGRGRGMRGGGGGGSYRGSFRGGRGGPRGGRYMGSGGGSGGSRYGSSRGRDRYGDYDSGSYKDGGRDRDRYDRDYESSGGDYYPRSPSAGYRSRSPFGNRS